MLEEARLGEEEDSLEPGAVCLHTHIHTHTHTHTDTHTHTHTHNIIYVHIYMPGARRRGGGGRAPASFPCARDWRASICALPTAPKTHE